MWRGYWENMSQPERINMANTIGVNIDHLRRVFFGKSLPSAKLAAAIEEATDREITRFDLRPDIYPKTIISQLLPGDRRCG